MAGEANSDFWRFSLSVYGAGAVQQECLDLQDRYGIDVNVLLFCAFVGAAHGAVLSDERIREASGLVEEWRNDVVVKLRSVRRRLKALASRDPAGTSLRESVKAAELEAERLEQQMLEVWGNAHVDTLLRTTPEEATVANVRTLLAIDGVLARGAALPDQLIANALKIARQQV
jgi:uncharacterized protein (TIGR02444 family)